MPKDPFIGANPYPELHVSEVERQQLIEFVDGFVKSNFQRYEEFVQVDKRQVDERLWKHVKSRDNLHVYTEHCIKDTAGSNFESWDPAKNDNKPSPLKDMPVVLRVGTLVGELDDLMFGVVNPTLDAMRIKTSYLHDLDSGAVLCPIIEPSDDEPFRSLIIKWMTRDAPLLSTTNLVSTRDFVYIEASGILHLNSGDRVGYHLIHSIEFPQTKPQPNAVRANLSYFGFFQQLDQNVIDTFGSSTVAPGGNVMRLISIRIAAEALLSATDLVYCGQMKKLSWMLQHRRSSNERQTQRNENCVMCNKKPSSGVMGGIGSSTCKLCYGAVCYPCKIRRRITFIALDGKLIQRKVTFCASCVSKATVCDAKEAAREQATGYKAYKTFSSLSSQSDTADASYSDWRK